MAEDILPRVRTSRTAAILDLLLRLLTHRNLLVRRVCLLLLLLPFYLAFSSITHRRPSVTRSSPHASTNEPDFVPIPPTAAQTQAYLSLLDRIAARKSAYNPALFTPSALEHEGTTVVGVTAVVLAWKRRKGLQLVVRHISASPFIREIIVWNNLGGPELVASDFVLATPPGGHALGPPTLRIINSPSNIHDAGKHLACSMASYKHCYFNDDDWLNVYMDSLYTNYLECCAGTGGPGRGVHGRIASNTMPYIHMEHKRWRFENPDIDLHTGFTWLGTGSFAPRSLSSRFITQQSMSPAPLDQSQALVADMFFSLWTNNYPQQLSNDLVAIGVEGEEVGWSRSAGVDQWQVVYSNIVCLVPPSSSSIPEELIFATQLAATRTLSDILRSQQLHLSPFPFPLAPPPAESETRAPCADDRCLFISSLTPFPPPSALTFPKPKRRWSVAEDVLEPRFDPYKVNDVRHYEKLWDAVPNGWPTPDWWITKGSWHFAVDDKGPKTCWESWLPPGDEDYIGLTFVTPRIVHHITLVGSENLGSIANWQDEAEDEWEVHSDSGSGWQLRSVAKPAMRASSTGQYTVEFDLMPSAEPRIRKLRFVSVGEKEARITLCTIRIDNWLVGSSSFS